MTAATITLLAAVTEPSTEPGGSAFASWETLIGGLVLLAGLTVAAFVLGRPGDHPSAVVRLLLRGPQAAGRALGLPDWAATAVSVSTIGLVIAGIGFSSDVAYHVAFGRDTVLFTAPHTAILVGLSLIAAGAAAGVAVATVGRVDTPLRPNGLHVPWSLLPLGVLGIAAMTGFPIDELWHQAYGVDVTMWSPPHLIMILGAAFTGLAMWLVLADVGVRPGDSRRATTLHAVAAMLTFQGFIAPLGEFAYGVPQFQQLFHPVLIALAGTAAVVLIRLVLGRGWALGLTALTFALDHFEVLGDGDLPIETRPVATFLGIAVAVELVAWLAGTHRRLRFALLAGLGAGTLGLGVEWVYNQAAHQPWTSALLPDAFVVGLPAALAAAVLATAVATAFGPSRGPAAGAEPPRGVPAAALGLAGLAALGSLLVPLPREVGEVTAAVTLEETAPGRVLVTAELDPPDAAENARWFMVGSWQHGGRESARMLPLGDGVYRAEHAITVGGWAKSLLRLHRGAEMMTVPIRLPADPEIDAPEIPAMDRTAAFEAETRYLLRETTDGPAWPALLVEGLFVLLLAAWIFAFGTAVTRIARRGQPADDGGQAASTEVSATGPRSP